MSTETLLPYRRAPVPPEVSSRARGRRPPAWVVPAPGFLFLAILTFPLLFYAVYLSLVNVDSSLPKRPLAFVGLDNYLALFTQASGRSAILTTVVLSLCATVLALLLALLTAYLLYHYGGRLTPLLTVFILIPMSVSPVAMALTFSLILNPLYGPMPQLLQMLGGPTVAVTSDPLGAVCTVVFVQAWQWSPLAVLLILGGIQSIPVSFYEAAAIDGASALRMFWNVTLPLLRPILAVAALFEFILCNQLFAAAQLLTNGGPGNVTTDLSFYIYKIGVADAGRISEAAAAGIVALAGAILLARFWIRLSRWEESVY